MAGNRTRAAEFSVTCTIHYTMTPYHIMRISKNDVMRYVGPLQLRSGQDAGAVAAIRAMHDIFKNNDSEAVLLIDA